MKKGKSLKLTGYQSYKINYGTVDAKNLKSVYLNIQTWVEPKYEIESPSRIVNNLSRMIKHTVLDTINKTLFDEKFIIDLDLRSSGIQHGKKSFLNLECYFYIKDDNIDFKSKYLKDNLKLITDNIIQNNFTKNKNFSFTLTKKQTI
jgi:hypothetical protein